MFEPSLYTLYQVLKTWQLLLELSNFQGDYSVSGLVMYFMNFSVRKPLKFWNSAVNVSI